MNQEEKDFLNHLQQFVSEHKLELFEKVLNKRTRHLTVAIEDVYQSHNASAVLRSCDCFGVQDVHVIENRNEYNVNKDVALGSSKWLSLHRYNEGENNTLKCINTLKKKGYKVVATTPHTNDVLLDDLSLDEPIALLFGTEKEGLSNLALEEADVFMKIPMYGFTESFNISVSAALCLHTLSEKIRNSDLKWQLNEEEKETIRLEWCKSAVKDWEGHWKIFKERNRK